VAHTPGIVSRQLALIDPETGEYRGLAKEHVRNLSWLFVYGQKVFSEYGYELTGFAFRQSEQGWTLILKVVLDDIPQVAFLTAHDPVDCVKALARKWHAGTLDFYRDKYR